MEPRAARCLRSGSRERILNAHRRMVKHRLLIGIAAFLLGIGSGLAALRWLPLPASAPGPTVPPAPTAGTAPSTAEAPWPARLGSRPRFTDVTAEAGIDFHHENGATGKLLYPEIMGGGVGLFDSDGDARLDIFLVNGSPLEGERPPHITSRLYRNTGAWRFADVTKTAGVDRPAYGQGCCAADYDNDGDTDLYVSNLGPNFLYKNRGDGTFEEVAKTAGVDEPGWGQSSSFLDANADGWLDLFVENYLTFSPDLLRNDSFILVGQKKVLDYPSPLGFQGSANRLYKNRGDGVFTDVTQAAGIGRAIAKGMGTACVDLDGDRDTDIFVANDSMENFLFRNRGDGVFDEVGLETGVAYDGDGIPEASMGVDAADQDGDGRIDLIVPALARQGHTLYRNLGTYFEDASARAGLAEPTAPSTGFSVNFLDYDSDADLDLFFTSGAVRAREGAPEGASYNDRYGQPDLLLASDGAGRFADVSGQAGEHFQRRLIGRGSAVGDLDGDGDLDLVISNLAERAVVLRNDTVGGHWLSLRLIPAKGNRDAIGAQVTVEAGGKKQYAWVHGSVTYLSQNDRRLHFGLGPAAKVDRIEVTWPDGSQTSLVDQAVDRVVEVKR